MDDPKLMPEQNRWRDRYIQRLVVGGLSREQAEEDFEAGYGWMPSTKSGIDLSEDPEDCADEELYLLAEGDG